MKDDPQEYAQRQQCDFLAVTNHEGETTDFHSLRHTCGAWLTMTGAHPKVVQQVLRHATITLTMHTYGHLFPSQEADAVGRMRSMLIAPPETPPEEMTATGTDDQCQLPTKGAQHQAQRARRETVPGRAKLERRMWGGARPTRGIEKLSGCDGMCGWKTDQKWHPSTPI